MNSTHAFTYLSAVQHTYDLWIHVALFSYIKMFSRRVPHPTGVLGQPWGEEVTSRVGVSTSSASEKPSPCVGDLASRLAFLNGKKNTKWTKLPRMLEGAADQL